MGAGRAKLLVKTQYVLAAREMMLQRRVIR